jgi:hypothetical protein
VPALLDDMGQLVGEQLEPGNSGKGGAQDDVGADRVGGCSDGAGRALGLWAGVDADAVDAAAEAWLDRGAGAGSSGRPSQTEQVADGREPAVGGRRC